MEQYISLNGRTVFYDGMYYVEMFRNVILQCYRNVSY